MFYTWVETKDETFQTEEDFGKSYEQQKPGKLRGMLYAGLLRAIVITVCATTHVRTEVETFNGRIIKGLFIDICHGSSEHIQALIKCRSCFMSY